MAITFTFSSKIAGANTGGLFGTAMSRISGPGPGETLAGAPASVSNTIMIGSPIFFGGFPEYVQDCQAFGSPVAFNGLTRIHAPDSVLGDGFGASVDLSGTSMIATGGSGAKVYVFVLQGGAWVLQQEFTTSDGQTGAVSIDVDTAVVGAGQNNGNRGAAYVFTRTGGVGTQIQKIVAGDLSPGDFFGNSVLLLGINLFVATDAQAGNTGAVYWYQLVAGVWTFKQKIAGVIAGEVFSTGLAFDGTTLVVGAAGAAGTTGHAYVYTIVGGVFKLSATLIGNDSAINDQFGSAVAVSGSLIVVGARDNLVHGAVYVFQNLVQVQKIVQTDPTGVDQFGTAVSLFTGSSWIVVGASHNGTAGAAYFYSGPSVSSNVFTDQLAFMGVRRIKGPDPLRSSFKFKPRTYTYDTSIVLTSPGVDIMGNAAPAQTLIVPVLDYDFELYELRLRYRSAAGVFQDPTKPFSKLWIYDPVSQQISNLPILDLYVNGLPLGKYLNGAMVPVLLYPNQSQIKIDFFSVVSNAGLLPMTCFVDLVGVQRIPCQ
jgi:hypothetical protein